MLVLLYLPWELVCSPVMLSPRWQMQPVLMAVPGLGRLPPALYWEPVALKELELVDHRMWGPLVLLALERLRRNIDFNLTVKM